MTLYTLDLECVVCFQMTMALEGYNGFTLTGASSPNWHHKHSHWWFIVLFVGEETALEKHRATACKGHISPQTAGPKDTRVHYWSLRAAAFYLPAPTSPSCKNHPGRKTIFKKRVFLKQLHGFRCHLVLTDAWSQPPLSLCIRFLVTIMWDALSHCLAVYQGREILHVKIGRPEMVPRTHSLMAHSAVKGFCLDQLALFFPLGYSVVVWETWFEIEGHDLSCLPRHIWIVKGMFQVWWKLVSTRRADMLFPWLLLVYCGMNMGVGLRVMEHSTETWQDPVSGENAGCGKGSKWLWGAGLRLHSNAGRGSWHLGDFHLPEVGVPWPRWMSISWACFILLSCPPPATELDLLRRTCLWQGRSMKEEKEQARPRPLLLSKTGSLQMGLCPLPWPCLGKPTHRLQIIK